MLFDAARPTCSECRQTALAHREYPRCSKCPLPAARASRKNRESYEAFLLLNERRVYDGMSGLPRPLGGADVLEACRRSEDPDGMEARLRILDRLFLKAARERAEREAKRHARTRNNR